MAVFLPKLPAKRGPLSRCPLAGSSEQVSEIDTQQQVSEIDTQSEVGLCCLACQAKAGPDNKALYIGATCVLRFGLENERRAMYESAYTSREYGGGHLPWRSQYLKEQNRM